MRTEFENTLNHHSIPFTTQQNLWREIETNYSEAGRYYHTIAHLNALVSELSSLRASFANWHTIVLAVAYHDIIYNPLKNNNEEKSAELAVARLTDIGLPHALIRQCEQLIRATQKHEAADEETNLFTDADLSILGASPAAYDQYKTQIRREYSIYPDIAYKPGRRKVLEHFLEMPNIFKTIVFRSRYESNARYNLLRELTELD